MDNKKINKGESIEEILSDIILMFREERIKEINSLVDKHNIICVKSNIVGLQKNTNYGDFVLKYFQKKIDDYLFINNITINKKIVRMSFDGDYILYLLNKDIHLKEEMITLEESEEIGRLIDIDVYEESQNGNGLVKSITRKNPRKCLICDNPVFICQRLKTHTTEELINKSRQMVFNKQKEMVLKALKESMMLELDLHPKFGLVTKYSNGSHTDMNYEMMKNTQDIIIPYLVKMFECGYNLDIKDIYKEIKKIGLSADRAMLDYTNEVNVYKGVIFSLGIIVSALGYKFNGLGIVKQNILSISKKIAKDVKSEYSNHNTFGVKAYKEYGIGGAREEAYNGFLNVKQTVKIIKDINDKNLLKALVNLIIELDDTVMLKRAKSIERYMEIKNEFFMLDINNYDEVMKLNDKMIKENISFGGCADILICALFIKLIQKSINIKI